MSKHSFHLGFVQGQTPSQSSLAGFAGKQIPLLEYLNTRLPLTEGHALINVSGALCG